MDISYTVVITFLMASSQEILLELLNLKSLPYIQIWTQQLRP